MVRIMLRVEAVQSGQMIPVPKAWSFDSSKDDPSVEAALQQLLRSCEFAGLDESSVEPHPDRGMIAISVETDDFVKRLAIPMGKIPAQLEPLVQFIEPRLEWRPRIA